MKKIALLFSILLFSCTFRHESSQDKDTTQNSSSPSKTNPAQEIDSMQQQTLQDREIPLRKLEKLKITGDFDGDKKIDTLYEHVFSRLYNSEIDRAPNPSEAEWDTIAKWFDDQDPDVYITLGQKQSNTLHLGAGEGLYCLINLGDINRDGKDEVALVVDYYDFSNVNHCNIYSLCKGKWQMLKSFSIFEAAFDFTHGAPMVFTDIKDYLEKRNNKWFYLDYMDYVNAENEEQAKLKILKLPSCP